jgi:hypothetical protein
MLTVTTIATTTALTTRARAEAELGVTLGADLDSYIAVASAAIVSYCHRPFAREVYHETVPGMGGTELQLSRTPLVGSPTMVAVDSFLVTDYDVSSDIESVLYRRGGWGWTVQRGGFDFWSPTFPRTEESIYAVDYTAGYILPPQNLYAVATLSVDSADKSFNDSAAGFPPLLRAGDIVTASGFTEAANNGRFRVTSATTSKLVVEETLVTEAAAPNRTLIVQTLPVDIEKACVEASKAFYAQRATDSAVEERQVGQLRVRYGSRGIFDQPVQALPPICVGLLRPWVRAASL